MKGKDFVAGRGYSSPKIAFIGEYPGEVEREIRNPFSGESGYLFHRILAELEEEIPKASEVSAYEDNAIMCFPETEEELERCVEVCRNRLVGVLEELKPSVIVLMGNTALQSILGEGKVTAKLWKLQGSPYLSFPHTLIPTYNPASVLRHPEEFRTYEGCLRLGAGIVTGTIKPLPEPKTIIAQNLGDVEDILEELKGLSKRFAADLETSGLNPFTDRILSIGFSADRSDSLTNPVSYQIPWRLLTERIYPMGDIIIQQSDAKQQPYFNLLKDFLTDSENSFLFHNAGFDTNFLRAAGIAPIKVAGDPMLLHYAIDERTGLGTTHGLKPLSAQYYAAPDWETNIWQYLKNKNDTFEKIPEPVLLDYAKFDTPYTIALDRHLTALAEPEDLALYTDHLLKFQEMLTDCQFRGVYIDIPELLSTRKQLNEELAELTEVLQEICGLPEFNPGSTQQVQNILFGDFRLKRPIVLDNKGQEYQMEGSGEPVLLEMLKGQQEFLQAVERLDSENDFKSFVDLVKACEQIDRRSAFILGVLVFRDHRKDISTYFDGVAKYISPFDRCIHPFTHVTGTETGRFTGSRPSLFNVKNSNRVKKIYAARPGYKIGYGDQAAMELRVFACRTKDTHLAELLRSSDEAEAKGIKGQDIHSQIGRLVFPYYEQSPKWWRAIVKTIVYGILYGRSALAIAVKHKLPIAEATSHRAAIMDLFPKVKSYENEILEELIQTHQVTTPFGRRRRFPYLPKDRRAFSHIKNAAGNDPVQSTASDINSYSMLDVWTEREELGAYPLWPIHDAVLYELKEENAVARMESVRQIMESTAVKYLGNDYEFIKFRVDPKVGDNWGDLSEDESFFGQILSLIGKDT